jgi:hypothetical protein
VKEVILRCHKVSKGKSIGEALVSHSPISFFGGVNPETGLIVEKGHELIGSSVFGKVLVFPTGKGSTAGSYQLYELTISKKAPRAIINIKADPVVAAGAIISGIPMVDGLDQNPIEVIQTGDVVEVDADQGVVRVQSKSG